MVGSESQLDDGTFGVKQPGSTGYQAWVWRKAENPPTEELWVLAQTFSKPSADAGGPVTLVFEYLLPEPPPIAGKTDVERFLAWLGDPTGVTVARHHVEDALA